MGMLPEASRRTVPAKARSSLRDHIIRVTEKAFDDFAGGGTDEAANRKMLGLDRSKAWQSKEQKSIPTAPARSASAWSAAARTRSSARFTGSPRASTDGFELVAGALSSTPEKARLRAGSRPRSGPDYDKLPLKMAKREARLKDGIEAVAIVTPNHMHYPAAKEFLKRGIHVICDKPLTSTLADAKKLAKAAEKPPDALFLLTHNYTGYPMVRQAREMVEAAILARSASCRWNIRRTG
jgi:hypothetical protein